MYISSVPHCSIKIHLLFDNFFLAIFYFTQASRRVLVYVWDTCLRLLHPFMPFLTEALWQLIPHKGESIMIADWPQLEDTESLPQDLVAGTKWNPGSLDSVVC